MSLSGDEHNFGKIILAGDCGGGCKDYTKHKIDIEIKIVKKKPIEGFVAERYLGRSVILLFT